jgi:hypothetical protein
MYARVDDLLGDNDIGLREGGVGGRRIAGLPVEAVVVGLAFEVGPDHLGIRRQRLPDVDDGVERFVVDVDQFQRVARRVVVLGDDERHLLALEPDLVGGQDGLHVVGQRRHPGEALLGQVGTGHHGLDLRMCLGRRHIDSDDLGVRVRRTQDRKVQHAGQADVVDVVALTADEPRILLAQHATVPAWLLVVVDEIVS